MSVEASTVNGLRIMTSSFSLAGFVAVADEVGVAGAVWAIALAVKAVASTARWCSLGLDVVFGYVKILDLGRSRGAVTCRLRHGMTSPGFAQQMSKVSD